MYQYTIKKELVSTFKTSHSRSTQPDSMWFKNYIEPLLHSHGIATTGHIFALAQTKNYCLHHTSGDLQVILINGCHFPRSIFDVVNLNPEEFKMITAEQARELGQVSPVTIALAMASVEQDVKAAAALTNTVLHVGMASVELAHGQTPSATALMHRVKELLVEKGFKVQFDIASVSSGLGSNNRKYGIRINW